jgi:hypothetical protein
MLCTLSRGGETEKSTAGVSRMPLTRCTVCA